MDRKAIFIVVSFLLLIFVIWILFKSSTSRPDVRYTIKDLGEVNNLRWTIFADISNSGEVVVGSRNKDNYWISHFFRSNGEKEELTRDGAWIHTTGINESGQVSGLSHPQKGGGNFSAFIWDTTSGFRDFDTFNTGIIGGLNNRRQVVGGKKLGKALFDAFVWSEEKGFVNVGTKIASSQSQALDVNDHGDVVGAARMGSPFKAFIWSATTGVEWLSGSSTFRKWTFACGIKNKRQVVGHLTLFKGFVSHAIRSRLQVGKFSALLEIYRAVLWEDGTRDDLNHLIAEDSGWDLQQAHGITDAGQIVGFGEFNGKTHAYLLTPIKESRDDGG